MKGNELTELCAPVYRAEEVFYSNPQLDCLKLGSQCASQCRSHCRGRITHLIPTASSPLWALWRVIHNTQVLHSKIADRGHRTITRMGKTAQDGPFTPIVKLVRNQIGTKDFNQLRGKGISLHSQGELISPSKWSLMPSGLILGKEEKFSSGEM